MALYTFLSSQAEDDSDQMFSDEDVGKDEGQKENSRGDVLLKGSIESTKEGNAPWVPDLVVNRCMICGRKFGMLSRKHHCRNCGKCICKFCAPSKNTRPIMSMGLNEPVRHCKLCYRSPIVDWAKLEREGASKHTSVDSP